MRPAAAVCVLIVLALGLPLGGLAHHDGGRALAGTPQFERATINLGTEETLVTSITFGPDGRLYAAFHQTDGDRLMAITLDAGGTEVLDFDTVIPHLDLILGLAFDPNAPAEAAALYLSRQEPADPASYQGRVTVLTGELFARQEIISGLPSQSGLQHYTNGLAFDGAGRLLIAQGSQTDAGAAGYETPLSGAILVADVHEPSFDGNVTYSSSAPPTDDNVDQTGGDISVFAPGLRNPYDLVAHSNGRVYATDNGPPPFAASSSCTEAKVTASASDELDLVEEGLYYGHPNRNRGRSDPAQCVYHAPEEPSSGSYRAPIAVLPSGSSCNGLAEYTSDAFAGEMQGDLLCAGIGTGVLRRIVLSQDGTAAESVEVLASDLPGALDVAVRTDGTVYVSGRDAIYVLSPPAPAATPTAAPPGGDANCDGSVNAIDAALILQLGAALVPGVPCPSEADVSGDGEINAVDAALVLQIVAGLIEPP